MILRHDLPDGSSHFDWMFQAPAGFPQESTGDPSRLVTFRCETRPDQLSPGLAQSINRLPDHRDHYLIYQGPVSGNRGDVTRVREGEITDCRAVIAEGTDGWELSVQWFGVDSRREMQVIRLIAGPNERWKVFSARQNSNDVSH